MAKGAAYELVMEMGVRRAEAARRPVSVGIKIPDGGSGPRSFFQDSHVTLGPQLPLGLNCLLCVVLSDGTYLTGSHHPLPLAFIFITQ